MKLYEKLDAFHKRSEIYLYYPIFIFGIMMFISFFISPFFNIQMIMICSAVVLLAVPLFVYMSIGLLVLLLQELNL